MFLMTIFFLSDMGKRLMIWEKGWVAPSCSWSCVNKSVTWLRSGGAS